MSLAYLPPRHETQEKRVIVYLLPQEPLATEEVFAFDVTSRIVIRLAVGEDGLPQLLGSQCLSPGEAFIFHALFNAYPYQTLMEELYAAWFFHSLTDASLAKSRDRLRQAQANDALEQELDPIRTIVSRIRLKVRKLGLDIAGIYDVGYQLQPAGSSYFAKRQQAEVSPIRHWRPDFLPAGHILAYNLSIHSLSYLTLEQGTPRLLLSVGCCQAEERVLFALWDRYPNYCPDDYLWASFTYGVADEATIELARDHLQEAVAVGLWSQTMKGVRSILSRGLRPKLQKMDLTVVSILGTGYMVASTKRQSSSMQTKKEGR